jgi:hypothetical protein
MSEIIYEETPEMRAQFEKTRRLIQEGIKNGSVKVDYIPGMRKTKRLDYGPQPREDEASTQARQSSADGSATQELVDESGKPLPKE